MFSYKAIVINSFGNVQSETVLRKGPSFLINQIVRLPINTVRKQKQYLKQLFRDVLRKRCSEIMQQIYRRTSMQKCDFNKVAKHLFLRTLLLLQYIDKTYESQITVQRTGHHNFQRLPAYVNFNNVYNNRNYYRNYEPNHANL